MRSRLSRVCVLAVTLTAATYAGVLGIGASPAAASACSTADGVTVVVDFHGLGGGVQQVCDADGGGEYANALFTGNGFDLTYVQKQPGFVCRIDEKPADDPCVNTPPADAYWGLWWSDGTKGSWTYSSVGAASLEIPDGGSVAFSWNSGAGQDKPGVAPPVHASEPTPTPSPSPSPSPTGGGHNGGGNSGGGNNSGGGATATPTPEPTTPASTAPTDSESATPTPAEAAPTKTEPTRTEEPTPTESATELAQPIPTPMSTEPTASSPVADEDGLPVWAAPTVVVVLLLAAAAAADRRRRRLSAPPEP